MKKNFKLYSFPELVRTNSGNRYILKNFNRHYLMDPEQKFFWHKTVKRGTSKRPIQKTLWEREREEIDREREKMFSGSSVLVGDSPLDETNVEIEHDG